VLLVVMTGAGVLALAPSAAAHALLARSDPPDGARLDEAPKAVTLTFTEEPEPSLSAIQVLDQQGGEIQEGDTRPVPGDPAALEVDVPALEEGVYTVVWRTVSEVDGHPTGGTFSFGVGVSPLQVAKPEVAPPPPVPQASALEMVGRWGLFIGLGLLVGGSWVGALAFRRPPRPILRLVAGACLVAAAGLVALALAQRQSAAVGLGDLVRTDVGRALLWRGVGIVAAVLLVGLALASARWRRAALGLAGLAAAATIFIHVEAGHAAASESFRWGQIVAQWAHFAAAGVWLGGLAALILGIRGEPDEPKATAIRRFSTVAAFALAIVAITGVVRALAEVGSWGDLLATSYGRLVLVKAGLLLPLAALGGVNRYRNVPRVGRELRGLRRVSRAEVTLAAGVLAAAAALATLVPPATIPEARALPAAVAVTGSDFATSVRARLEVDPAIPGPNRFRLRLTDYDTGDPVEAQRVALRFSPELEPDIAESTLDLKPDGDGVYEAIGPNLAVGGPWDVTALVQQEGGSVEIPLRIATECETTEIPGPQNLFTIHVVEVLGVGSVQGYLLPSGAITEVHFTFLDAEGREITVHREPAMLASKQGEEPQALAAIRLTRGHFLAEARLDKGTWRFDGLAEGPEGSLWGCFAQSVRR
jgi:copper transport protein